MVFVRDAAGVKSGTPGMGGDFRATPLQAGLEDLPSDSVSTRCSYAFCLYTLTGVFRPSPSTPFPAWERGPGLSPGSGGDI
jgi:hypothetical protein